MKFYGGTFPIQDCRKEVAPEVSWDQCGEFANDLASPLSSDLSQDINGDEDILRLLSCFILFALTPHPIPSQDLSVISVDQLPFWYNGRLPSPEGSERLPTFRKTEDRYLLRACPSRGLPLAPSNSKRRCYRGQQGG